MCRAHGSKNYHVNCDENISRSSLNALLKSRTIIFLSCFSSHFCNMCDASLFEGQSSSGNQNYFLHFTGIRRANIPRDGGDTHFSHFPLENVERCFAVRCIDTNAKLIAHSRKCIEFRFLSVGQRTGYRINHQR